MAGFNVPGKIKVLAGEAERTAVDEPFSYEKLSPVLGIYKAKDFLDATEKARLLVEFGGLGHTAVLYTDPSRQDRFNYYAEKVKVGRILVNMPFSQGGIRSPKTWG